MSQIVAQKYDIKCIYILNFTPIAGIITYTYNICIKFSLLKAIVSLLNYGFTVPWIKIEMPTRLRINWHNKFAIAAVCAIVAYLW